MSTRQFGGGLAAIVFLLFWSILCLAFDIVLAWTAYRQTRALGYERVGGTIRESKVSVHNDSDGGTTYGVDVKYEYELDRQRYQGDRYRYGAISSSGNHAQQVVDAWPAGTAVDVYYDKDNPADACLEVGLDGGQLFLLMFLMPFNTVMVLGWGYLIAHRRSARLPAGGVVIRENGLQTRLRLEGVPAGVAGILTAGILSFGLIFVVGFGGGGFYPSLGLMTGVWAFIVLVSLAAAGWTARRHALGAQDLVIDDETRSITLPPTHGRKEAVTLPWQAVRGVEIEERKKGNFEDESARYAPILIVGADHVQPRRETLAKWTDRAQAERFAEWLRQRLRV
jgi:hypothetical protein